MFILTIDLQRASGANLAPHRAEHAEAGRLGNGCFCNVQESRALCGDRVITSRRLVDGADAVVLSATEESAGFGEISQYSSITSKADTRSNDGSKVSNTGWDRSEACATQVGCHSLRFDVPPTMILHASGPLIIYCTASRIGVGRRAASDLLAGVFILGEFVERGYPGAATQEHEKDHHA